MLLRFRVTGALNLLCVVSLFAGMIPFPLSAPPPG